MLRRLLMMTMLSSRHDGHGRPCQHWPRINGLLVRSFNGEPGHSQSQQRATATRRNFAILARGVRSRGCDAISPPDRTAK